MSLARDSPTLSEQCHHLLPYPSLPRTPPLRGPSSPSSTSQKLHPRDAGGPQMPTDCWVRCPSPAWLVGEGEGKRNHYLFPSLQTWGWRPLNLQQGWRIRVFNEDQGLPGLRGRGGFHPGLGGGGEPRVLCWASQAHSFSTSSPHPCPWRLSDGPCWGAQGRPNRGHPSCPRPARTLQPEPHTPRIPTHSWGLRTKPMHASCLSSTTHPCRWISEAPSLSLCLLAVGCGHSK